MNEQELNDIDNWIDSTDFNKEDWDGDNLAHSLFEYSLKQAHKNLVPYSLERAYQIRQKGLDKLKQMGYFNEAPKEGWYSDTAKQYVDTIASNGITAEFPTYKVSYDLYQTKNIENKEMNSKNNDIRDFCYKRYVNKAVKLLACPNEKYSNLIGKTFKCISIEVTDRSRSDFTEYSTLLNLVVGNNEENIWINSDNVVVVDEISNSVSSIKKQRKLNIAADIYGTKNVLQLQNKGKLIYLSANLRFIMDIAENEGISFAIDRDKEEMYICKDKDGYPVNKDGFIESEFEWNNILRTFNNEKYSLSDCKKDFYVSHHSIKEMDNPDYIFFPINCQFYKKKEEKKKVEVDEVELVPSVFPNLGEKKPKKKETQFSYDIKIPKVSKEEIERIFSKTEPIKEQDTEVLINEIEDLDKDED